MNATRSSLCVLLAASALLVHVALPVSAHAQQSVTLHGRVHAAGIPIAGATVRAVCHAAVATTAADGTWRLGPLTAQMHEVSIEHIGYAARTLDVTAGSAGSIDIELTAKPLSLATLVVTAARRVQQLKDVTVATEVIERAELRGSGSADLAAVLTERTGVALEGGHPVGAGVMLQGLGSERVLVLLDGQPLLGRLSGKLDLARIPVSMIERVEVVKGPQSTLYGSDAMGGVVNVITRTAGSADWQAGVDVLAGSRGRVDAGAHASGRDGRVGYAADGAHRTIELVPGHQGDAGTYATRWDGAARVEWQPSDSSSLFAGILVHDEAQRWRSGALYTFADNMQWAARTGAHVRSGALTFSPTLYATQFRHLSRRSTQPRPVADSGDEEVQQLIELDLLLNAAVGGALIDAGIEARRDAIDSDRVHDASRRLYAAEPFVQMTVGGAAWSIAPGARVSWSEQWGSHFTPRIAALYRPKPAIALRASAGYGFRAPSFKELYMDFLNTGAGDGYRVRGNASLQPETSQNITTSVEWAGHRVYVRAQAFYNRFDDFIETVELSDSSGLRLFTYGNIDDGRTYGTELDIGGAWRGWRAEGGYAYLVADDRRTEEPLLGRPAHAARGMLAYAHASGLRATLTGVVTGRTPIARTDSTTITRAAFTRVDFRLSQELPRGFDMSAGIDNIADMKPASWPGYNGRQLHFGIGWRKDQGR